ncbi:MAG: hypothetical protein LHW56_02990 [Candidatus Cloacimonetes bacterium]|jgi:hypothetical protein|nr:hypothetical protein [Candidatus Cloacimonadota bacterium]MDY0171855.1 hypothetical protein [Candidatus Cloacimonadaceae bacterium]
MSFRYIGLCLILAACCAVSFLGAQESSPPDSLLNIPDANLGGDLQHIMHKHKLLIRMYPLLFRTEDTEAQSSEKPEDFEEYRGRRIAKINIISKDVFNKPNSANTSRLFGGLIRLGNTLHPKTRERLIRDQLFFTEGDSLNPEYLISNLQYIYDQALFSEIEFEIVYTPDNEVEINVYTRQKFFLKVNGSFANKNKFNIGIFDRNLFGLGHSLENTWYIDSKNQETIGWESSFTNSNVLGSFAQGIVHWVDLPGQRQVELKVQRPFIYPLFRYSGGSEFNSNSISAPKDSVSVNKMESGAWIARNFDYFDYPRYAYAALSVNRDWYPKRPSSTVETGMPWQESFFALGALAFTQSVYRYMPRVSSFLDNDHLPVGFLFELYSGVDIGEYKTRPFSGLYGSLSIFPGEDQYLYLKSALEGFWVDGRVEEGVFALEPLYISQTTNLARIKARSFINARYVRSRRILETQSISLKSSPVYRGTKDLSGTDLIYTSLEEDLSLPLSMFGFQITTFAFADMAFMRDDRLEKNKNSSLFSQGLGLRLRNPSLIWDFIELFLSIDQSLKSKPGFGVELRLKSPVNLEGFTGRRPQRYDFQ